MTVVERCATTLRDQTVSMNDRFHALFQLRSIGTQDAIDALLERLCASREPSALLRHEVAFALGQMRAEGAIEVLTETLRDASEDGMVRHECAEALGAIGVEKCVDALREACADAKREVRETAELALRKLEHRGAGGEPTGSAVGSAKERLSANAEQDTPFYGVDPVPAMPMDTPFEVLREMILNDEGDMWSRYSAMFALRNQSYASQEACKACADVLGTVLSTSESALLKHEICYVLGQLQSTSDTARDSLVNCLENGSEHPMVRHEAAEALGSIAHPSTKDYLIKYSTDPEPIISQSCEIALDIMRHEQEGVILTKDGETFVCVRDEDGNMNLSKRE